MCAVQTFGTRWRHDFIAPAAFRGPLGPVRGLAGRHPDGYGYGALCRVVRVRRAHPFVSRPAPAVGPGQRAPRVGLRRRDRGAADEATGIVGAAALLVGVFPGNVTMAMLSGQRSDWYQAAAWARLPLQIPLVWWAVSVARSASDEVAVKQEAAVLE